jgi:hypothetical protein
MRGGRIAAAVTCLNLNLSRSRLQLSSGVAACRATSPMAMQPRLSCHHWRQAATAAAAAAAAAARMHLLRLPISLRLDTGSHAETAACKHCLSMNRRAPSSAQLQTSSAAGPLALCTRHCG